MFCVNATSNQEIDDRLCVRELGEAHRPISRHLCGTGACAAQFAWSTGDFGQVSSTCSSVWPTHFFISANKFLIIK